MKAPSFSFLCALLPSFFTSVFLPVTGSPVKTNPPEQVFAVPGEDVILHIRPPTSDHDMSHVTTVEWSRVDGPSLVVVHVERNGKELVKDKAGEYVGRTVLMSDSSLKLLSVTQKDSSMYRCMLLREEAKEVKVFVSLIVGEVPEVNIKLQRTSANEIFIHYESRGWSLKPQISLLDGRRNDLPAETVHTQSFPGPDNLYSIRAHVDAAAAKETGTIICRMEIPGTSMVKEKWITVRDEFHPLETGLGRFVVPVIVFILGVALGVSIFSVVSKETLRNLWSSLRGFVRVRRGEPDNLPLLISDKDYGDITKVDTTGSCKCMTSYGNELTGVEASFELARRDLEGMKAYEDKIVSATTGTGIHPAIIAAIISRQSQFGATLRQNGFGHTDANCFGLMQINKLYHTLEGGPYDEVHLKQGVSILITCIQKMVEENPSWTKEQQLKGGLACYIAGVDVVSHLYEDVDKLTPYGDFANDVVARAQWFAKNAF